MLELIKMKIFFIVSWWCRWTHWKKDVGLKFEPHVCNKYHDVLITAYELKNIAILSVKDADFRCVLWGISKNESVNILNNYML